MGHSLQPTNAPSKNWINPLLQTDSYSKPDSTLTLTSTIRYLPQTCIKNLTSTVWLSGSGPYLSAWTIEANNSVKLVKEFKVFTFERVKSVKVVKECENGKIFDLVVVGGKSLKFIKLDLTSDDYNVIDLSLELQARDWILDLIQISTSKFNLLLTHNIILKLELNSLYEVVQEELIYSPVNCLLYSGKLINDELVIIGTIFNSVIIWNYNNTEVKFEKKYGKLECELKAHEGVIFNVDFTKDLSKLVSVSDDRSIRVWERNVNNPSE
ncbi:hypothetical protein CONCODRAFT_147007 [Conidiobolus coronatus NRRL 28638]|uniref:Uncharacterized protein n=1 Tax=Conidiobolus coronatus (strain ATCC 28846 / CBS 209.66 / NRRL 28638) TaxID=796925 RepID=A0A137P9E1_CONC2|nr:hypothetical protein CONCODRAFT_147007 [Conidiobolus coronatus NRRL 28638]|eukprot:KXN71620.1 hypothetical protein CONCODRAFT_147007 [Conidiobolus coronatus NRRL 28638]